MSVVKVSGPTMRRVSVLLGIALISAAVVVSLFNRYEIGSETWGYWTFARVFSETGEFIIPGRSPLYILYLQLFDWMGYPASVSVEYVVSTVIVIAASVLFFRRYLGTALAILVSVLWIPYFQMTEPPVQKLALACVLLAITVRRSGTDRVSVPASYALLSLAYMFRGTFIAFAAPFVVWDVWRLLRRRGGTAFLQRVRPGPWWLSLLVPGCLFVWSAVQQSDHKWNYATAASRDSTLSNPKSVMLNAFVSDLRYWYDNNHPGLSPDDLYRSFVKDISGEGTILGIVRANPGLVARHIGENIISSGDVAVMDMTLAGHVVKEVTGDSVPRPLFLLVANALLVALLWGAWKVAADGTERLLVVGTAAYLAMLVFFGARFRYMAPEVPVLVLGAIWYGRRAGAVASKLPARPERWFRWTIYSIGLIAVALAVGVLVTRPSGLDLYAAVLVVLVALGLAAAAFLGPFSGVQRWSRFAAALAAPAALLAGSYSTAMWAGVVRDVAGDVRRGELRVMERGRPSDNEVTWKGTLGKIEPLIGNCRGIIGPTHHFLAAFTDLSLDRFYDTSEIPPTGRYGDPGYDGLRPDRIDCVYIPVAYEGSGEKYLIPYVEALEALGAKTHLIGNLGSVTVLRSPP